MGNKTPLFLPFEQNRLLPPQDGERFIGIRLRTIPDTAWCKHLDIIQPWRPDFLQLEKTDFCIFPQKTAQTDYDGGLLLLDKHRRRNENRFLQLLQTVRPGGVMVICGDKSAGGTSFRKWAAKIISVEDSMVKNHAVTFWCRRPGFLDTSRLVALKNPGGTPEAGFETAPGMFSYKKIDAGSALLAQHLRGNMHGAVADFGAGWGYLSAEVLMDKADKVTALDLYEADFEALEAARRNLASLKGDLPVHYYWQDLGCEPLKQRYDTIISNPPFHAGHAADITLGQKFIHKAAQCLKMQGRFVLVANRQLPYEKILNDHFRHVEIVATDSRFKALFARK